MTNIQNTISNETVSFCLNSKHEHIVDVINYGGFGLPFLFPFKKKKKRVFFVFFWLVFVSLFVFICIYGLANPTTI